MKVLQMRVQHLRKPIKYSIYVVLGNDIRAIFKTRIRRTQTRIRRMRRTWRTRRIRRTQRIWWIRRTRRILRIRRIV